MMKFSMKHPERLRNAYLCFWVGFFKFFVVIAIEFCNCLFMCSLLTVTEITFGYIKMYTIGVLDKFTFMVLESGDPFAHMIDAPADKQP